MDRFPAGEGVRDRARSHRTERAEIRRARQAMRRCIAEVHTAEEDD